MAQHASEYGLNAVANAQEPQHHVQGVNFVWAPLDVVETLGEPYVQFGNHGFKFSIGDDLTKPGRRGYIAVQHAQVVPHLYVEGPTVGALTVKNVAASAIKVLGTFSNDTGSPPGWTFGPFAANSEQIDLPEVTAFRALCWTGHGERKKKPRSLKKREAAQDEQREKALLAAGTTLLNPEAIGVLAWLCQSFDVELRDGWLVAYSAYGDVTTNDDEVWDWVLSAASRLVDLLQIWGIESPRADDFGWYTAKRAERPTSLDGSLNFLRRSQVRQAGETHLP